MVIVLNFQITLKAGNGKIAAADPILSSHHRANENYFFYTLRLVLPKSHPNDLNARNMKKLSNKFP